MEALILKVLEGAIAPARWIFARFADQTRISIVVPSVTGSIAEDCLAVQEIAGRRGLMQFAIATGCSGPVEIHRLEVAFPRDLQLLDPGGLGFFRAWGSPDLDLPFQLSWDGMIQLQPGVQQAFAIDARFAADSDEYPVRVSVRAQRLRTASGGFRAIGRPQETTKRLRLVLVKGCVLGLPLRPHESQTSPQPFVIQSATLAMGGPGSVVTHEILEDGSTKSNRVDLPSR